MVPIRAFDIATMERLGREIYEQDQLAWKASDVVFAKRTASQRGSDGLLSGWITGSVDGKPRVRFVKAAGAGIEALYDVVFDGGVGSFSMPSDKTLSAEDTAQYDARMLALKGAANKCSPNYNTVALKDPAGPGWLVWALAATTDSDPILVGGHFRFTISADGKSVVSRDEMSKGCLKFSRRQMSAGGTVAGLVLNHLVSLTPLETHVFTHLNYQLGLAIGTSDGLAWKVDGGRIANIDMDMPAFDGFAARVLAGIDEICAMITSKIGEEPKRYYVVDKGLRVILPTEEKGAFKPETPSGHKIESILCVRRDVVPAPNDYKVPVEGYPLMIADRGVGHPKRTGTLTVDPNGHFTFPTEGEVDAATLARIDKRLRGFESAIRPGVAALSAGTRGTGAVMLSQTRNDLRGIDIGALGASDERGGHFAIVKGAPVYVPHGGQR
jgi:hypothetical protein